VLLGGCALSRAPDSVWLHQRTLHAESRIGYLCPRSGSVLSLRFQNLANVCSVVLSVSFVVKFVGSNCVGRIFCCGPKNLPAGNQGRKSMSRFDKVGLLPAPLICLTMGYFPRIFRNIFARKFQHARPALDLITAALGANDFDKAMEFSRAVVKRFPRTRLLSAPFRRQHSRGVKDPEYGRLCRWRRGSHPALQSAPQRWRN
jgi:hypothetical protein